MVDHQKIQIGRKKILLHPTSSTTLEQPSWTRRGRTIYEHIQEPAWPALDRYGQLKLRFSAHHLTSTSTSTRDVISGNLSKSACLEGSGSLWAQISDGRGRRPSTTVGVRKLEWLPFRVVSKYPHCIVWFCHKARACDGQTDRRTELRRPRPHRIAASRGNTRRSAIADCTARRLWNVKHAAFVLGVGAFRPKFYVNGAIPCQNVYTVS